MRTLGLPLTTRWPWMAAANIRLQPTSTMQVADGGELETLRLPGRISVTVWILVAISVVMTCLREAGSNSWNPKRGKRARPWLMLWKPRHKSSRQHQEVNLLPTKPTLLPEMRTKSSTRWSGTVSIIMMSAIGWTQRCSYQRGGPFAWPILMSHVACRCG